MGKKHPHYDLIDFDHQEKTGFIPIPAFTSWCVLRAICTDYNLTHTTLILDMFEHYGPSRGGIRSEQLKEIMVAEAQGEYKDQGFLFGKPKPNEQPQDQPPQNEGHGTKIYKRLINR
jgi:hypothetical protein